MKFKLTTKKGAHIQYADSVERFYVIPKQHTTDADIVQFWTWIKYELKIDFNKVKSIIGCKPFVLNKIKTQWGDKFYFDKP